MRSMREVRSDIALLIGEYLAFGPGTPGTEGTTALKLSDLLDEFELVIANDIDRRDGEGDLSRTKEHLKRQIASLRAAYHKERNPVIYEEMNRLRYKLATLPVVDLGTDE